MNGSNVVNRDSVRIIHNIIDKASKCETSGTEEFIVDLFGKGYRWGRIHYASIADENGKITHIVGQVSDIQLEKDREALLSELNTKISENAKKPTYDTTIVSSFFDYICESPDIDMALNKTLAVIGEHYKVSRAYIFEDSQDHKTCSNTYEWCADGVQPEIGNLQELSYENALRKDFWDYLDADGMFIYPDTNKLPDGKRNILAAQGIKSIVLRALTINGVYSGYIGFDDCSAFRDWTSGQIGTLSLLGNAIVISLIKKREKEISKLSDDFITALEDNSMCVSVINPENYKVVFANQIYKEYFGENVIDTPCLECTAGRNEMCINCPITLYHKNGKTTPVEACYKDGLWLLSQASPIRWHGRDMFMVTSTDVTEQHKTKVRLQALSDSIPGGIVVFDYAPEIISVKYFNDTLS